MVSAFTILCYPPTADMIYMYVFNQRMTTVLLGTQSGSDLL